jgi:hypothetical protein
MKTLIVAVTLLGVTVAAAMQGALAQNLFGTNNNSPFGSSGLYGTGSNPSSHYVSPYTTQSGTYVGGHHQTNPNSTQFDNYSTRGNYNPHTGVYGTRSPRY